MGVVLWILFGLITGSLATLMMPGPAAGGMIMALVVGVAGGLIGGAIGTFALETLPVGFDGRSMLMAMIGSLVLLFGYRCFAMRTAD